MVDSVSRRGAIAAALAAVGLASALAACASSNNAGTAAANGAGTSTITSTSTSTAQSAPMLPGPSPTASSTTSQSVNPGGRMTPAPSGTALAQVAQAPPKSKLVPIDQASQSADGRSLYLQIEARGGACGQYMVVVQESASRVAVGLAQLPVRTGVMCPMYIGPRTFTATLSAPIGARTVIDLATGAPLPH